MATFYNIVHKTDKAFESFHASSYEYATRLFVSILEARPDLSGHLEIVTVTPDAPKPTKPALDRPWNCTNETTEVLSSFAPSKPRPFVPRPLEPYSNVSSSTQSLISRILER
jgi:hypothetical protein